MLISVAVSARRRVSVSLVASVSHLFYLYLKHIQGIWGLLISNYISRLLSSSSFHMFIQDYSCYTSVSINYMKYKTEFLYSIRSINYIILYIACYRTVIIILPFIYYGTANNSIINHYIFTLGELYFITYTRLSNCKRTKYFFSRAKKNTNFQ